MEQIKLYAVNLRLFDADGGVAGSEAAPAGGRQATGGEIQASDAAKQDNPQDRQERYRKAREEFRAEFDQEFQRNFDRRHRDYKQTAERAESMQELVELMAKRYRVEDGDLVKIKEAAMRDDYYWQDLATETGMDVNALRQIELLKRQNRQFELEKARTEAEAKAQEQMAKWSAEAETLVQKYPGFQMENELQNRGFQELLKKGIPMTHAYEVLHMDEIKSGIIASTAQETERRVVDGIRANGLRPTENGASGASAATIEKPKATTAKERAELAKRAARGEVITLK